MADRTTYSLPYAADTSRLLQNRRSRFRLLVGALVLLTVIVVLVASYVIGTTPFGTWVLVAVLGVMVGALITLRPELGAYILIVFVYLNLSSIIEIRYGIPSLNKLLVLLIFVGTMVNRVFLLRHPFSFDRTQRLILLYGAILLIASTRADHQIVAWDRIINWLKDFAILIVFVLLADRERVWRRMQWILLLSAMLVAGLSVYQTVTGDVTTDFMGLANAPVYQITSGFDSSRVTGPLDDPNFYAQVLLMTMPIALYRFFDEPTPLLKFISGMAFALITMAAIFTYSRGAIFALLLVGLLVIRERRWNPYRTGLIILLVLMFVIPLLPVGYLDRVGAMLDVFSSDTQVQSERSLTGRSSEMIIAVQMFLDNPLFGVGPDNYSKNYLEYSVRLGLDDRLQEREAHSLFLQTAAELGIIGLLVFIAVVVSALVTTRQAKRRLVEIGRQDLSSWITGLQYGLISYMVTSLFLHDNYIRYFWLLMGLVVGVGYMTDQLVRSSRASKGHLYSARPVGYFHNVPDSDSAVK